MTEDALNATFAALADPTRRAILARLASGEASVMELAEPCYRHFWESSYERLDDLLEEMKAKDKGQAEGQNRAGNMATTTTPSAPTCRFLPEAPLCLPHFPSCLPYTQ
jgi:hypothetical protein